MPVGIGYGVVGTNSVIMAPQRGAGDNHAESVGSLHDVESHSAIAFHPRLLLSEIASASRLCTDPKKAVKPRCTQSGANHATVLLRYLFRSFVQVQFYVSTAITGYFVRQISTSASKFEAPAPTASVTTSLGATSASAATALGCLRTETPAMVRQASAATSIIDTSKELIIDTFCGMDVLPCELNVCESAASRFRLC